MYVSLIKNDILFSLKQGQTSILNITFPEFWQKLIFTKERCQICQNSRLVQTKCSLVCQANSTSRDRPRFQTARFSEFWQSTIPANEGKKMPKLSARANQMLIGVPILKHEPGTDLTNFYFPSLFKDE